MFEATAAWGLSQWFLLAYLAIFVGWRVILHGTPRTDKFNGFFATVDVLWFLTILGSCGFFAVSGAWQWIVLLLLTVHYVRHGKNHGEPRTGNYNGFLAAGFAAIAIVVLHSYGFFSGTPAA